METTTTPAAFHVGQVVTAGRGADFSWTFTVLSRTARFVTLEEHGTGDVRRVGVRTHDGEEWASPFGTFSMAPVVCAGR